jgi:hypothetical protein
VSREPDLRELVGDDLEPEEEARLRRVHDLLLFVGPPPELPPSAAAAPGTVEEEEHEHVRLRELGLPPRGRGRVLALAGALVAAALIAGFLVGRGEGGFETDYSVPMQATAQAGGASAVIDVGERDDGGNWPLRLKVSGLPELPEGSWYELYLTRGGNLAASCGTFRTLPGETEVRLNAPYSFEGPHGWVIVERRPGREPSRPLLRVTA